MTPPRQPVPDESEIATERIKVRESLGELLKSATAGQQSEAATQLRDRAAATEVEQDALLSEALTLAASAADPRLMIAVTEDQSRSFETDPLSELTSALKEFGTHPRPADERRELILRLLETADEQMNDEHYETAKLLVESASTNAGKLSDSELKKEASQRELEVEHWLKLHAAAEAASKVLGDNPDDADAQLARGQYLAIARHDWDSALKHLAKGSDARLCAAAELELQAANDPGRTIEIGTAWLDLAEKATVPAKACGQNTRTTADFREFAEFGV